MGKYDRFEKYQEMQYKRGTKIHPIWRGIGCLMMLLIPILAYAAADTFYDSAPDFRMFGVTLFPNSGTLYRLYFSMELFGDITLRISPFHLLLTILFSVIGYLIFSFVYAVIYRISGPPMYGPTDAPPPRRTKKWRG